MTWSKQSKSGPRCPTRFLHLIFKLLVFVLLWSFGLTAGIIPPIPTDQAVNSNTQPTIQPTPAATDETQQSESLLSPSDGGESAPYVQISKVDPSSDVSNEPTGQDLSKSAQPAEKVPEDDSSAPLPTPSNQDAPIVTSSLPSSTSDNIVQSVSVNTKESEVKESISLLEQPSEGKQDTIPAETKVKQDRQPGEPIVKPDTSSAEPIEKQGTLVTEPVIQDPIPSIPLDSDEDDILDSFNEWKQKQYSLGNQPPKQDIEVKVQEEDGETVKNAANSECAKVVQWNKEAKTSQSVLNENKDEYMISPCSTQQWFIVKLCDVLKSLERIEFGNLELFSSHPSNFSVYVSSDDRKRLWRLLDHFQAADERKIQTFISNTPTGNFRHIKFVIHSHYGSEHFCPLTIVRVFGRPWDDDDDIALLSPHANVQSPEVTTSPPISTTPAPAVNLSNNNPTFQNQSSHDRPCFLAPPAFSWAASCHHSQTKSNSSKKTPAQCGYIYAFFPSVPQNTDIMPASTSKDDGSVGQPSQHSPESESSATLVEPSVSLSAAGELIQSGAVKVAQSTSADLSTSQVSSPEVDTHDKMEPDKMEHDKDLSPNTESGDVDGDITRQGDKSDDNQSKVNTAIPTLSLSLIDPAAHSQASVKPSKSHEPNTAMDSDESYKLLGEHLQTETSDFSSLGELLVSPDQLEREDGSDLPLPLPIPEPPLATPDDVEKEAVTESAPNSGQPSQSAFGRNIKDAIVSSASATPDDVKTKPGTIEPSENTPCWHRDDTNMHDMAESSESRDDSTVVVPASRAEEPPAGFSQSLLSPVSAVDTEHKLSANNGKESDRQSAAADDSSKHAENIAASPSHSENPMTSCLDTVSEVQHSVEVKDSSVASTQEQPLPPVTDAIPVTDSHTDKAMTIQPPAEDGSDTFTHSESEPIVVKATGDQEAGDQGADAGLVSGIVSTSSRRHFKLINKISLLEENLTLTNRYLEELSKKFKKQKIDMQRQLNLTLQRLLNVSRRFDHLVIAHNQMERQHQQEVVKLKEDLASAMHVLNNMSYHCNLEGKFEHSNSLLVTVCSLAFLSLAWLCGRWRPRSPTITKEELEALRSMPLAPRTRMRQRSGSAAAALSRPLTSSATVATPMILWEGDNSNSTENGKMSEDSSVTDFSFPKDGGIEVIEPLHFRSYSTPSVMRLGSGHNCRAVSMGLEREVTELKKKKPKKVRPPRSQKDQDVRQNSHSKDEGPESISTQKDEGPGRMSTPGNTPDDPEGHSTLILETPPNQQTKNSSNVSNSPEFTIGLDPIFKNGGPKKKWWNLFPPK